MRERGGGWRGAIGERGRRFLQRVNRPPVAMTWPHFFPFAPLPPLDAHRPAVDAAAPEFWDRLRSSDAHFVMPEERGAWLAYCEGQSVHDGVDPLLRVRAAAIVAMLRRLGIRRLFSVGVGTAALEYHVKKTAPAVALVCSDYAPRNAQVLRRVFIECEDVIRFDIVRDDWSVCGSDPQTLCLIWRVDPHLTNEQWRAVFAHAHAAGVRHILFGAGGVLTLSRMVRSAVTRARAAADGVSLTQAGWVRTEPVFPRLWEPLYRTRERSRTTGMTTFLLERA